MTNLVEAYQDNDLQKFESVLKNEESVVRGRYLLKEWFRASITDDAFIRQYLEELMRNVRTQVLLKLIQPYTRLTLEFIAKKLNIPLNDVEQLLITLILDHRIHGRIDQARFLF